MNKKPKSHAKANKKVVDRCAAELTARLDDGDDVALLSRSFRFWRSVARRLAETADVVATRLRHRAVDREILEFYAFDDPEGHTVAWWSQNFISQANRYEILRDCLLSEIEDAREWATAEALRLNADRRYGAKL